MLRSGFTELPKPQTEKQVLNYYVFVNVPVTSDRIISDIDTVPTFT